MKKLLLLLLLVPLVVTLVFVVSGCGPNAEQILKDSMRVSKDGIKTAHFDLVATTKLPRAPLQNGKIQKQQYVQKSTGDYDLGNGNFEAKTELASGVPVTMLNVDNKQYWQIAGNWYLVPSSVQISPPVTQALSTSQYIKEFKELTKLGNTKIDGEDCYHIKGVPNMDELVKQPGISDLLKDPTGQQIRTVDELKDMKVVFDYYIRTKDSYFKRAVTTVEAKISNDLIKLGYGQAGDRMSQDGEVTFSKYNEKLNLKTPEQVSPLPGQTQ